jgi:hypothetical protein
MTATPVLTPWHVRMVGIGAVLFNSIGGFDFVMSLAQGAEHQANACMAPAQIAHCQEMPSWTTVAGAVGVFGAFPASIVLLLRRKLASPVFADP